MLESEQRARRELETKLLPAPISAPRHRPLVLAALLLILLALALWLWWPEIVNLGTVGVG